MLPLLERIVDHLERVQRVGEKEVVDRDVPLDYDGFEEFILQAFERAAGGSKEAQRLDRYHWRWEREYLRAFVDEIWWGLVGGAGARWTAKERADVIAAALSRASSLEPSTSPHSPPRERLLDALIRDAEDRLGTSIARWPERGPWNAASRYCAHLGLTTRSPLASETTSAGATLIRLRGLDRLRWLLAIETSLATSSFDPWSLDLDAVRAMATQKSWTTEPPDEEGAPTCPENMARWAAFGALEWWEHNEHVPFSGYRLTRTGSSLFGELVNNDANSFRTLARAWLDDEREHVLSLRAGSNGGPDHATRATLRHARMVAHEIRNALLPVQHALRKVWAAPEVATADLADPRQRIEEGLARIYRFVDDSLRLTPLTTEEAATFGVMDVIEEARRQLDPSPQQGIRIETIPAAANPRCRGHQGRLALAVVNLLRNAVQAGGVDVRLQIGVDARAPGTVAIRVSDDGPGIPDDRRDHLFTNGVSYREDGSGHGLAFVRQVVEGEMGGSVRLLPTDDTPGACFELTLPTVENES